MAQRVQVLLICDLHDGEVEGVETINFAVDNRAYEIDVCGMHAGEFREAMAPFVGAGRRVGSVPRQRSSRRNGGYTHGFDPAAVRAWAKSKGIKVSERGRIAADVLEQYTAAGF